MMKEKTMQLLGKVKLGTKRNAPELLLGGALVTGTTAMVLTGRASIKAKELAEQRETDKVAMAYKLTKDGYTEEEIEVEIRKTFASYALSLVKEYAVPVALYAATVGMVFASYKIQKDRQLALSATLTACTAAYNQLVNKLKNGAAAGLTAKEVLDGIEVAHSVDPETGELIPSSGRRGRTSSSKNVTATEEDTASAKITDLQKTISEKEAEIASLQSEVKALKATIRSYEKVCASISNALGKAPCVL